MKIFSKIQKHLYGMEKMQIPIIYDVHFNIDILWL